MIISASGAPGTAPPARYTDTPTGGLGSPPEECSAHSDRHALLPDPAQPRAARMRRRVRGLQGPREPAAPPGDDGVVPVRRPRDLVVGRGENEALGLLPFFVAQRATAVRIGAVDIP
jgi:hypothetical protein